MAGCGMGQFDTQKGPATVLAGINPSSAQIRGRAPEAPPTLAGCGVDPGCDSAADRLASGRRTSPTRAKRGFSSACGQRRTKDLAHKNRGSALAAGLDGVGLVIPPALMVSAAHPVAIRLLVVACGVV
jgi:hypothetical protein